MKKIYLMRHGETLFNIMGLNQGQCDSPLTENGIEQAKTAKNWLGKHHISFDDVYSSSSERAIDTTEIITDLPYIKLKELKEIYLGTKEATHVDNNPLYPYGDFYVNYGGEDLDEFTNRIYDAIDSIARNSRGNSILIVSHGIAIKRFLTKINYESTLNDYSLIQNCGIVCLEYNESKFKVLSIIDPKKAS